MILDGSVAELVASKSNHLNNKLTIIIPTYNRTLKLIRTIKSLSVIKDKTDVSVLLIDNGSETFEKAIIIQILDGLDFNYSLYINKYNIGATKNFNLAVQLSTSEYIMFLFDDDVLNLSFNKCIKLIETNPANGVYFFNRFILEEKLNLANLRAFFSAMMRNSLNSIAKYKHTLNYNSLLNTVPSFIGAFYRRDLFLSINGFDDRMGATGDYEFTIRYWENFGIVRYKYQIINYYHGSNDSSNPITYKKFPSDNLKYRTFLLERLNIEENKKLKLERTIKYNFDMESKFFNRRLDRLKFFVKVVLNYLNIL